MERVRLDIGHRCPYACPFCESPRQQPTLRSEEALAAEIDALEPSRTRALVLYGGEPTVHPALPTLVARAVRRGVRDIELHTNAALADRLPAIVAAGGGRLSAVVGLHSLDEGEMAALTGVRDALTRTTAGVDALLALGVSVALELCLCAANYRRLPDFVDGVAARWPPIRRVEIAWYTPREAGRRDPLRLAPAEGEAALRGALDRARGHGIALAFSADWPVVPCLFADPAAIAPAFVRGGGVPASRRVGSCARCVYAGRCIGPSRAQRLLARGRPVRPIRDPASPLLAAGGDRASYEHRLLDLYVDGEGRGEVILRPLVRCNQRCPFCCAFAPDAPAPAKQELSEAVARVGTIRPARVAISGGEPALLGDELVSLVRRLRAETGAHIELQTNATLLTRPGLAVSLAEAGLDEACVSLHGHTETLYDEATASRGQLERALAGIDALRGARIDLRLNHVLTTRNTPAFPDFVAFLVERFGPPLGLTVSMAHPIGADLERFRALTPRLRDVRAPLRAGLERALDAGLTVFRLQGPCGFPYCLLDADPRFYEDLDRPALTEDDDEFVQGPPCAACRLRDRCLGLRRYHALLHGFDDLRPLEG